VHQPHAKTAQDISRPSLSSAKDAIRMVNPLYELFHGASRHPLQEIPAFVKNGF
jgi:hypothetical protein